MTNDSLCLYIGSKIKIRGIDYIVEGYIVFKDKSGASWTEYKIKSTDSVQVKWLSIDKINNEYSVYIQQCYSSDFQQENILQGGYKKIEESLATVIECNGNVDVDLDETVFYEEYEDDTKEFLLSIEEWNGEFEYSKGYYIDKEDIKNISYNFDNSSNKLRSYSKDSVNNDDSKMAIGALISIGIIIAIILIAVISEHMSSNSVLSTYIKSNSNFMYVTSITSDLDNTKKADVYSVNKTVEEATKLIINGLNGKIEDVQENIDDGTVVIVSGEELGLIYVSQDSRTLIQISKRDYVYSSRNTTYSGNNIIDSYYRDYYYETYYTNDKNKYGNAPNGYSNYKKASFIPNNNNQYKNYSDSVRQSSANSRTSSGGGTSSGK